MPLPLNRASFATRYFLLAVTVGCATQASETPAGPPATAAEAAKVLDLAAFPIPAGAEEPSRRTVAGLTYRKTGDVKMEFQAAEMKLALQKWAPLPDSGGSSTDQSATETFGREGFVVSLSAMALGDGKVMVDLLNHGNVRPGSLPVPEGAKSLYIGPLSAMYVVDTAPAATAETCKKLLEAKGWVPYGRAGDVQFFKQNDVRLTAMVASAPAQGGKTSVSYSTELMSANLPAPPDAEPVQYSDYPTQLSADAKGSVADVAKFYRAELAKSQWSATTDHPIKIDFKEELIFRNPAKDLLTLEMRSVEGKTRILLRFQTAAEVEEMERRIKIEIEKKKAKKS